MRLMRGMATEMRRSAPQLAPAQMAVLYRLSLAPSTISELARHMGVSLPSVSKSIDILTIRGWAARSSGPVDRRQTVVRLTAAGRRVNTAMRTHAEQHMAELLERLSAADREQVTAAVAALERVLPPADACWPPVTKSPDASSPRQPRSKGVRR